MSDIAIRVENLGKQYRLGEFQGYRTFRETVSNLLVAPFRRSREQRAESGEQRAESREQRAESEERRAESEEPRGENGSSRSPLPPSTIWALRDVSFEVPRGQVLGIIGRNGAGKSTLLKILSRITEPTTGRVEIHGRVGSLLEVGTGFHPELTGRENIFVNGAILGMSRAEIKRKFDEIVDFAGVENFIDTPVKRYSSGMQVRLAFAVAAHLEPEILIVDEVLAVGDAEFQKKCLGKMDEVSRSGRTILFVSHNMAAVQSLCRRVMVLDSGTIYCIHEPVEACVKYSRLVAGDDLDVPDKNVRGGRFQLLAFRVQGDNGYLAPQQKAVFRIPLLFERPCSDPHVHLFVQTSDGITVFGLSSGELLAQRRWAPSRDFEFSFSVQRLPLLPGRYRATVKVRSYELGINEYLDLGECFEVVEAPVYGMAPLNRRWHGLAVVDARADVSRFITTEASRCVDHS